MAEIIILGKIVLTIFIIIAGISVLSLAKTIFNSLIVPIVELLFPLLSSIMAILINFVDKYSSYQKYGLSNQGVNVINENESLQNVINIKKKNLIK